jgi:glycosyltransferase involved in cell wall biosynthesis
MKPLRILEVTKSTGGVAEYVRWLAWGLDKTLFEITVVCLSEDGVEFARELAQIQGVKALSLSMNRYRIDILSDGKVALELARMLRQEHFDLVHVHASKPGFLTRLAAIGLDIPIVYSPHCFSFHPGAGKINARIFAFFERMAARYRTTRILVVAESEKKLAQKYGVGKPDQFVTVNSGIDPQLFEMPVDHHVQKLSLGLDCNKFTIGSVGRLSDQKAPLDFIRAAGILAQSHSNVQFLWIGDGPLMEKAQELSQALGISSLMHFAGQRTDTPACLAVMDCFVLVSRWEGFPLVALEAMAAGKPIVATNIDGTNDAIRAGVEGLLVSPGDIHAIARAIEQIMNDPTLAHRLRSAGQVKVQERFTRRKMLQGIGRVYQDIIQRGSQ